MTSRFRCSEAALDRPMAGTAATDAGFLLIEHPGPWGNKAFAESRLVPAEVKAAVAKAAADRGIRIQLIRRPGERAGGHTSYAVFLAHPATGRLDRTELVDHAALAGLDLDLARRGAAWQPHPGPLLLVCTNGRRDVCCAELGRPVAQAVAAEFPEEVWETTHLGGHRYAVAALTLPDGMSYGRVDAAAGLAIVRATREGRVVPTHLRGRTTHPPAVQAAEIALLEHLGLDAVDSVSFVAQEGATITLRAAGVDHDLDVTAVDEAPARLSCADDVLKPATTWVVGAIRARDGSATGSR